MWSGTDSFYSSVDNGGERGGPFYVSLRQFSPQMYSFYMSLPIPVIPLVFFIIVSRKTGSPVFNVNSDLMCIPYCASQVCHIDNRGKSVLQSNMKGGNWVFRSVIITKSKEERCQTQHNSVCTQPFVSQDFHILSKFSLSQNKPFSEQPYASVAH